ncbi:hypothetical protein [Bradyrhizobium sp. USDA 3458]|uniref:hypothetical protein n=1 Tax=Bradyrhizobium sp. USDA 3458 TaxID=2591461 RepID=UPI0032E037E7
MVSLNDCVVFESNSVKVHRIREETECGGLRITANATIETAKIRIVIDIAFGDSVEPGLQEMDLPVLSTSRRHISGPTPAKRLSPRNFRLGYVGSGQ